MLLDRKVVGDLIETRLMLESETAFWQLCGASEKIFRSVEEALAQMEEAFDDARFFRGRPAFPYGRCSGDAKIRSWPVY